MTGELIREKQRLRAWARARCAELPDVSPAVTAHLARWLRERGVRRVLAYRALPGEPNLEALAGEFELLTTRTVWRPEPRLTLHAWEHATQVSKLGVLEPPPGTPEIPLERVEAVLVPGLAFDERGGRLGYGGGFYDRLLPLLGVPKIGVVPAALIVAELPHEAHDARVDLLATETGVRPVL